MSRNRKHSAASIIIMNIETDLCVFVFFVDNRHSVADDIQTNSCLGIVVARMSNPGPVPALFTPKLIVDYLIVVGLNAVACRRCRFLGILLQMIIAPGQGCQ